MTPSGQMFRLDGKVAVVTGGYGGFGAAICEGLVDMGARVAVAGHNREKVDAFVARLRERGGDAFAAPVDALSVEDTRRMMDEVATHFGRLDILVNTVGGQREEKADDVTDENFSYLLDLNLKSAMFQAQAAAKYMKAQGGGKQIHFGSVRSQLGLRGRGFAAYCAAKSGLTVLCKQLAVEWAEHRINVNVLAPTFVRTSQVARFLDDPQFYQNIVSRIPLGRVGEVSDVVGAALFFVSPASDFITGQTLYLDGGLTATQ
ncbi:MAG: SDR family oxidoreductase [Gemmatimonadetes bacterium]|nr:SDR family oxidoreductase [Gemmatimonadota bacterium]